MHTATWQAAKDEWDAQCDLARAGLGPEADVVPLAEPAVAATDLAFPCEELNADRVIGGHASMEALVLATEREGPQQQSSIETPLTLAKLKSTLAKHGPKTSSGAEAGFRQYDKVWRGYIDGMARDRGAVPRVVRGPKRCSGLCEGIASVAQRSLFTQVDNALSKRLRTKGMVKQVDDMDVLLSFEVMSADMPVQRFFALFVI